MISPKKNKALRPDSAPSMLISLTMQMMPPIAGQEISEKLKKCQLAHFNDTSHTSDKFPLTRTGSSDSRRHSIDDSLLHGSDKSKTRRRKVSDSTSSQRSREFEDVMKPRGLSSDDGFLG